MNPHERSDSSDSPAPRKTIRVFISSTFRDMQAERDELVLRVFPELRKKCRERGLIWGEVDLRWGVTDEEQAEGKVLPICLAEIRRCRPYFIGLLGERYGWVPDEIPAELLDEQQWLAEHRERSVTELEIIHGVLADPKMTARALFYFRDPGYVDSLPSELRREFVESPTPDEIRRFGNEEAQARSESRRKKLSELKERIRKSGHRCREDYRDSRELGELVRRDLGELIDTIPVPPPPANPLDRAAAAHEALAVTHIPVRTELGTLSGVYKVRREYYSRLDRHILDDEPPLVVIGEEGAGKTALLANWVRRYRSLHPGTPVIPHYVGATPESTDWEAMLRRLIGELGRSLDLHLRIPQEPDALKVTFANSLHMASRSGRAVVVIDGLEQLEDRAGALDLAWLPPEVPANIRLVLSTGVGRPVEELERREWPTLEVLPLGEGERACLIRRCLGQYSKRLEWTRVERIAREDQTGNPLYLRALLEELRVFGIWEELDERIDYYLAETTIRGLYTKILERYERDYDRDRPNLVREALRHLWAARRGLSEAELLDVLGEQGKPLPSAFWSPLSLAAERSFMSRSGMIGFSHSVFREAVEHRYVGTEDEQRAAHRDLSAYFAKRAAGDRRADELPWQLAEAHDWGELYEVLRDVAFFDAVWTWDELDVRRYWALIETNSDLRVRMAYRSAVESPETLPDPEAAMHLAMLHGETGCLDESEVLWEYLADYYERAEDAGSRARALTNLGGILRTRGRLEEALERHRLAEQLCKKLGDRENLQRALGNQGLVLRDLHRLEEALAKHREEQEVCRALSDLSELAICLGHQGVVLYLLRDLDGATAVIEEQERVCRALGNSEGMMWMWETRALVAMAREDLDDAMEALTEQERIARSLVAWRALQAALGNQGMVLFGRGDVDGALERLQEQEAICTNAGATRSLADCLKRQAGILVSAERGEEALAVLHRWAEVADRIPNGEMKVAALVAIADLLGGLGRPEEALPVVEEARELAEALDRRDLQDLVRETRERILSLLNGRNDPPGPATRH